MSVFRVVSAKLRRLLGGIAEDADFHDEMREHVRLLTERLISRGMTPEDADREARRQFGNVTLLLEDRRNLRTVPMLETLWRDVRLGTRMFGKNPGFTAAVVLTLALGIGANTAIFSICDAVLLKPLPYADPDRLVMLWERSSPEETVGSVAPANFIDWREQSASFSGMAALNPFPNFILASHGEPARLSGAAVSSNFFQLLGVRILLGREFLVEEDQPGRNRVAILSFHTWLQRFGAQADIVGKDVTMNNDRYTVVGVLPRGFEFTTNDARNQVDVWVPLALNVEKLQRGTHPLRVIARLKPGVAHRAAQADLDVVANRLARSYPQTNHGQGIACIPLAEQVTANVRPALLTLLSAVGLVLLIACANVANLLLSRAAARQREMALRMALGASRRRLGQQLLTESLLLAILGGTTGLLLAFVAIRVLAPYLPADIPRASEIAIDMRVLVFTGLTSIVAGIAFGLAPLFQARQLNGNEALKQSSRMSGIQTRFRSVLVAGQIAIALTLLVAASLMGRSLWMLLHVSPGFRTEQTLTARLTLPGSHYREVRTVAAFQRELLDSVRNLPGVQSAGLTAHLPLGGTDNAWAFSMERGAPLPAGVHRMAKYRPISPGYLETIGIPVLRGRGFHSGDHEDAPLVVVINESMARTYWGQKDPIGQRLRFETEVWRTIVGVVGDVRHESLDGETRPEMYVPFAQTPYAETRPTIVVRTALPAASITPILRRAVSEIDRALPVDRVATMDQLVSSSVAQLRFRTILLAAFSMLALAMASIGIYGVMNHLVIQRTREFGIHLAVGATRGDVLRLVLGRAVVLIASGLVVGLMGSMVITRFISTLLYGVAANDPLTLVVVPLLLSSVALAASYIPARRATRTDPIIALRYE